MLNNFFVFLTPLRPKLGTEAMFFRIQGSSSIVLYRCQLDLKYENFTGSSHQAEPKMSGSGINYI